MGETEWKALVGRAQKIEKACKENAAELEDLKNELATFKSKAGGGKTKKGKSFWEKLMSDDNEEKENEENDED